MGKQKTPPPPDYTALANQQGQLNKEAGLEQWRLNNSPIRNAQGGQRKLISDPDSPSGYRIEESFGPEEQENWLASMGLSKRLLKDIAPGMLDTLQQTLQSGFDTKGLPEMVSNVDTSGLERLKFNIPGAQYGFDRGQIQGNVDFGGLNPLESGNAVRDRVEKAGMDKFMARMQPEFERQADALNTRIANMGGNTSSRAARQQVKDLGERQDEAMRNAQYDSVLRGGEEAARQFGMGLQGRQQGVDETMQQAGFRNQAQQQDFGQLQSLADLWNQSRGQDAQLQAQQAGFNNQTVMQNIENMFRNANLQNSARSSGLNERAQLRQMPLNEIMAVLSGTQINPAQFNPAQSGPGWNPANVYQAGQDTYNANVAAVNARNAQRAAPWNALTNLGAAWLGKSDRRLKSHITRIGSTDGGQPLYRYIMDGRPQVGVMADETPDDAKVLGADGYWMVDYSKVR